MTQDPGSYSPDRSIVAKIQRRLTQWRTAKPIEKKISQGIISFSFDDFPKSAAEYGADTLDEIGAAGTYYASSGLYDGENVTGRLYAQDDLERLVQAGHEIGLHTHSHLNCAQIEPAVLKDELAENADSLRAWLGSASTQHFAWPYGETNVRGKQFASTQLNTARGITPGINNLGSDLMQLRACELTPKLSTYQRAKRAIETVARKGGWLIIFTHDVRPDPSPFGVHPETLKCLVKQAKHSGATISTVGQAYQGLVQGDVDADL